MYQLDSAIVKPLDGNGRWRGMEIGSVTLNDLFNNFKRVIATLKHPALTGKFSLDIEKMRSSLAGNTQTFNDWLVSNGNRTLPTSTEVPYINTRYANFSDAVRAGYGVTPTHPTISASSSLTVADKPWLLMTKDGMDYQLMYNRCLINVNGFYHQTDYSTDGLFVVDGMKTCEYAGRNELGILSFLQLGDLNYIPIKDEMIYVHKDGELLRNNCYVDTGVDLSNKTVMLVLGGYLHVLDKRALFRISKSAFGIDFGQIPLVDRFYESYKVLDLSVLGMETAPTNDEQISINNLYSDAVLRKYLTMSQTFFVVLDNPEIFVDAIELRASPFPGCYTSSEPPIYPLIVGRGRHEVFWPRKEHDRYSVNISASWKGVHNYDSVPTLKQLSVSDSHVASMGYENEHAHFLLIGSDV
jgi:hypothetical protein